MFNRIKTWTVWCIKEATGSCAEVTRLLSQGMDQPLPWHVRCKIRVHFLICDLCQRYGRQIRFLREAMRKYPERLENSSDGNSPAVASPRALSPETKERLKQKLREQTN
ncbi:MAG: hypothetical protein HY043_13400 [Verrucomicrobia bacterium]|nr:hypothetical protein [Verrucomicrobiota bacterium]